MSAVSKSVIRLMRTCAARICVRKPGVPRAVVTEYAMPDCRRRRPRSRASSTPSPAATCGRGERDVLADAAQARGRLRRRGGRAGVVGPARPPCRRGGRARVHRQPARRHRGLQAAPAGRAARRRRGRLAVQPPRPARPAHPPRPDPRRGQLEWRVPRPGRPAQPHREPDQGRRAPLRAVERGLHRRLGARGACATWLETGALSHDTSHVRDLDDAGSGPEADLGRALAAQLPAREGDHRRLRRGLHGDVQRDHRRRAAQPARHLQGAPVAERAGRRDGPGRRRRGAGRAHLAGRRRA